MNQKEKLSKFNKFFKQAIKRLSRYNFKKAISDLKECLTIYPDHLEALKNIVYAYNKVGEYEKAIITSKKILSLDQNSEKALNNMFFAYDQTENFEEVLKIFKKYIEIYSANLKGSLKSYKATSKFSGFMFAVSTEALRKINTLDYKKFTIDQLLPRVNPCESINLNLEKSFARSKIGYSERKVEILELALEKFPLSKHLWNSLGYEYCLVRNDYNRAESIFKKSLEIDSEDPYLWILMGILYYKMEEFQKSIDIYEQVLKMYPHSSALRKELPGTDVSDQKLKSLCDKVALINQGNVHNVMGEYEKAIVACKKALKIDITLIKYYNDLIVETNEATNSSAWMVLSISYNALGMNKKAIKSIKKAIKFNKYNITAWNHFGFLYQEIENFKRSRKVFQHVVELDPNDFEAWYNLAKVFFKEGRLDDAMEANNKSLNINPQFNQALKFQKTLDSYKM
ncbi:MAG: tetratricopeptide repeat protein [Candidatus Odinarchaeota archaeon]